MSGIFHPLFPLAPGHGLRLITLNRRAYEGTTPYTEEEVKVIEDGNAEKSAKLWEKQGIYLALFVDRAIQKLNLVKGTVAIVGWSLGSMFVLLLSAAILKLHEETRARLKDHVNSIILWGT